MAEANPYKPWDEGYLPSGMALVCTECGAHVSPYMAAVPKPTWWYQVHRMKCERSK